MWKIAIKLPAVERKNSSSTLPCSANFQDTSSRKKKDYTSSAQGEENENIGKVRM